MPPGAITYTHYPLLPPGFGFSQNPSVADGTSIGGVTLDDEVASTISASGPLPMGNGMVYQPPLPTSTSTNGAGVGVGGVNPPTTMAMPSTGVGVGAGAGAGVPMASTLVTNMNGIPAFTAGMGSPATMMTLNPSPMMNGMHGLHGSIDYSSVDPSVDSSVNGPGFSVNPLKSGLSVTTSSVVSNTGKTKGKKGRLGNREYFQVVEAVNSLQEKVKDRNREIAPVKLNSSAVMKVTKKVLDYEGGLVSLQSLRDEIVAVIPLASCAKKDEFDSFLATMQTVARTLVGKLS